MAKKGTNPTKEICNVAAKATRKVAREIFEANADMSEVHVTSDGTAFFTLNNARCHAGTLKNREVASFKRADIFGNGSDVRKNTGLGKETMAAPDPDNADTPSADPMNEDTPKIDE